MRLKYLTVFLFTFNIILILCFLLFIYLFIYLDIGIMVRVFANGPGDLGSIPGRHTKDSKNGT